MNWSPPGSSVHGISQARKLEWVAISFSRGSSQPKGQTHISCIAGRFFATDPPGKPNCQWTTISPSQPLVGTAVGPSPTWAAVREQPLVAHLANGWWSGGHQVESEVKGGDWGKRWSLGSAGELRGWELCPAKLQSPGQGRPLAWVQAWGQHWTSPSSLPLWPNGGSSLPVKPVGLGPGYLGSLRSLRARCILGTWLPQWWQMAQSGDLALREPPAEICLLLARIWTSEGESCAWGPFPFLSEQRICLVEVCRDVVTWPWPDLKSKGSDIKKCVTTHHAPPSPFLEKGFADSFQGVCGF